MKERPILFNGDMVRAILDGRKTQARRVMKYQLVERDYTINEQTTKVNVMPLPNGKVVCPGGTLAQGYPSLAEYCPYGNVGDRLWVRETWRCFGGREYEYQKLQSAIQYRTDFVECEQLEWRSSIHMPRWASRITLEITNVRVERLLNLTDTDALAEGILPLEGNCGFSWADGKPTETPICECCDRPVERFAELWDKINGKKHSWAANPWVWVLEFKRIEEAK